MQSIEVCRRATDYDDQATAKRMEEVPWRNVPTTDSRRWPEPREPHCRGRCPRLRRTGSVPQGSSSGKATGCDNMPIEAYRWSVYATNELFRICRMMSHSERIPPEMVRGHSLCCIRRAPVTTWRNIVRSASSATRTSCSLPSWRVDWWRCWRTEYRTPKLDSGRLEDAGTTCVPSDGSSTWSSRKSDKLSSPSSTKVLR